MEVKVIYLLYGFIIVIELVYSFIYKGSDWNI
jgi:hypothetical protein